MRSPKTLVIHGGVVVIGWPIVPLTRIGRRASASRPGRPADSRTDAEQWLEEALAEGPQRVKELREEWKDAYAGSMRTLERAKRALDVEAFRKEVPGPWWWKSSHTAKAAKIPEPETNGGLAQDRQVNTASSPQENNYGVLGGLGKTTPHSSLLNTEISNTANTAKNNQLEKGGGVAARSHFNHANHEEDGNEQTDPASGSYDFANVKKTKPVPLAASSADGEDSPPGEVTQ